MPLIQGYVYAALDYAEEMETPEDSFDNYEEVECVDCPENIFSQNALEQLYQNMLNRGWEEINVETGGGFGGERFPNVQALVSQAKQIHPTTTSLAFDEYKTWYREFYSREFAGSANSININVGYVCWRRSHSAEGVPRKLLQNVEVSHLAEAYHNAGILAGFVPDRWHVEIRNLETSWCNESRKVCSATAAMWRKADGTLISPDERITYSGSTMCPHAMYGVPCYAPYPSAKVEHTGKTPNARKNTKRRKFDEAAPIKTLVM